MSRAARKARSFSSPTELTHRIFRVDHQNATRLVRRKDPRQSRWAPVRVREPSGSAAGASHLYDACMNVLAIDVGSSSVKMGVLRNNRLVGRPVRHSFPTRYDDTRAEVDP